MRKLSGCVFIKNNYDGAYCLWESLTQLLPVVDELLVMDLGSDDGTYQTLQQIQRLNSKVRLVQGEFKTIDAGVFADLANDLIQECTYDDVLYFQADEIWHEDLVKIMLEHFERDEYDLTFWRIQFRENFQKVKWFPHPVHRVGHKNNFNFVGDGMNSDRYFEPKMCSNWDMGHFIKWGDMGQEGIKPYVNEMITDVSMVGGFLGNIQNKRNMHAPFWHEEPTIENMNALEWLDREGQNANWTKKESPYNIPKILKYHLGNLHYTLQPGIFEMIASGGTF